jgi:RNA polymerase sigma factor (sigma-70 family)
VFNSKDIKRWERISRAIDPRNGKDILQDFLLKVLTNGIELDKLSDAYVYQSLNNAFKNTKRNKNKMNLNDYYVELSDVNLSDLLLEYDDLDDKDKTFQSKLNAISESYSILNETEKKLFYIHFVSGMKLVDISKETGISQTTIFLRIKNIKEKIKDYYDKSN